MPALQCRKSQEPSKTMKLLLLASVLVSAAGCVYRAPDRGQDAPVTTAQLPASTVTLVRADHVVPAPADYPVRLEDALILMSAIASNVVIRYDPKDLKDLEVSLQMENVTVEEALTILPSQHGLTFSKSPGATNVYTVVKPK